MIHAVRVVFSTTVAAPTTMGMLQITPVKETAFEQGSVPWLTLVAAKCQLSSVGASSVRVAVASAGDFNLVTAKSSPIGFSIVVAFLL